MTPQVAVEEPHLRGSVVGLDEGGLLGPVGALGIDPDHGVGLGRDVGEGREGPAVIDAGSTT